MKNALIPLALACLLLLTLIASSCTGISTASLGQVPGVEITTTSIAGGSVGKQYSLTLAATGGTQPYTWSISPGVVPNSGSLPTGLSLNSTSGIISGTPSAAGQFTFIIKVADSSSPPKSVTQVFLTSVAPRGVPPLTINTSSLPAGQAGVSYSATLSASGGTAPYAWTISSGALPAGLALNSTSGVISGTPTSAGPASFSVEVTDSTSPQLAAIQPLSISIAAAIPPLTINTSSLPGGQTGVPYSTALSASGGTQPYTWSISSGVLPSGVTLNSASGTISGTPTSSGQFNFIATVTDSSSPQLSATQGLLIFVSPTMSAPLTINTSSLPAGATGILYSAALSASGGTQPYTWSITAGALPAGVTLNAASGVISGTPKLSGMSSFTVKVTDSSSSQLSATQVLSIAVSSSGTGGGSIDIVIPASGATVSGSVIVSGTVSDSAAITTAEISINGEPYVATMGTTNWTYWWDTTSVTNGPATITLEAIDTANNIISSSISVVVQNATPACGVTVSPTDNLKSLVASNPAGTTFCIQPGVHHDFDVLNQGSHNVNGDQFVGLPGAIENGAETLTGWTQVSLNGTTYWTTAAGAPIIDTYNPYMNCNDSNNATFTCYYSQALYVDNTTYEHAYRLQDVTPGVWYYEFRGLTDATVISGGANYAVGDLVAVAGGTGCPNPTAGCGTVEITSVDSSGTVTGINLRALGYGYPESLTTQATAAVTGNGSGLTLSVKGGSGGIVNNIYLASSELPNSNTVELGKNAGLPGAQWLFHSVTAQNITIQGLTVEKYAGPLDTAPITVNHIGSYGTASGWVIQNNEVTLNMHDGIFAGYGTAGTSTKVLNNTVYSNGQQGIGGGNPTSFFTISGNNIYSNDTSWVPALYGCGSIKFGGPSTGGGGYLVSYNNVHDEPNSCGGLWSDDNMGNVTWDHNTVTNISGEGIRIEVSGTGPISVTNNIVSENGGPQIEIVSSSNTSVQHNNVSVGSQIGIRVSYDGRTCGAGCASPPADNNVSLNSVSVASSSNTWAATVNNEVGGSGWVVGKLFDSNTYCVPSLPWSAASWQFPNSQSSSLDFTEWQAKGQDTNGLLTDGNCANPLD